MVEFGGFGDFSLGNLGNLGSMMIGSDPALNAIPQAQQKQPFDWSPLIMMLGQAGAALSGPESQMGRLGTSASEMAKSTQANTALKKMLADLLSQGGGGGAASSKLGFQ